MFVMQTKPDQRLRQDVERRLGIRLGSRVIHHIDENPCNNDPHNLAIMRTGEHTRWHRNLMYRRLVKLTTVAQLMEEVAMIELLGKIVDVIEDALSKEIPNERDPEVNNKLAALGDRLESLAMDIKDRTSS